MEDEARQPDFKGEGVAIWKNYDKNGKIYLTVKLLGNIVVRAWKNEPKQKEQVREEL